ncbi:hypothetical protein NDU88_004516 [Pleurodeles waltl]|uniref:Uncharacterized protein n=1 Tax=Pleurodeles waltl TaxID=8319 RepID=A0AAV7WS39_PLEWA|nr:hypothetical protein NDU88_004516 [Pleurodeles waltl]
MQSLCLAKSGSVLWDIQSTLTRLEKEIRDLETILATKETADIAQRLRAALTDSQEAAEREALFRGKYAQVRSYGEGEKPDRALATTIHMICSENTILEVRDPSGRLLKDIPDILKVFATYNEHLYSSTREIPPDTDNYL